MFFLYDLDTCRILLIMGEKDARALINDPNDNKLEHRTFSYDAAELAALEARGGDPGLLLVLRDNLGERDGAAVCWGRRHEERLPTEEEWADLLPADTP
jgi:hypothetical protein